MHTSLSVSSSSLPIVQSHAAAPILDVTRTERSKQKELKKEMEVVEEVEEEENDGLEEEYDDSLEEMDEESSEQEEDEEEEGSVRGRRGERRREGIVPLRYSQRRRKENWKRWGEDEVEREEEEDSHHRFSLRSSARILQKIQGNLPGEHIVHIPEHNVHSPAGRLRRNDQAHNTSATIVPGNPSLKSRRGHTETSAHHATITHHTTSNYLLTTSRPKRTSTAPARFGAEEDDEKYGSKEKDMEAKEDKEEEREQPQHRRPNRRRIIQDEEEEEEEEEPQVERSTVKKSGKLREMTAANKRDQSEHHVRRSARERKEVSWFTEEEEDSKLETVIRLTYPHTRSFQVNSTVAVQTPHAAQQQPQLKIRLRSKPGGMEVVKRPDE